MSGFTQAQTQAPEQHFWLCDVSLQCITNQEVATYDCMFHCSLPLQDRPIQTTDGRIIFASTHVPNPQPRHGWTAIYSSKEGGLQYHMGLHPRLHTPFVYNCSCRCQSLVMNEHLLQHVNVWTQWLNLQCGNWSACPAPCI